MAVCAKGFKPWPHLDLLVQCTRCRALVPSIPDDQTRHRSVCQPPVADP